MRRMGDRGGNGGLRRKWWIEAEDEDEDEEDGGLRRKRWMIRECAVFLDWVE